MHQHNNAPKRAKKLAFLLSLAVLLTTLVGGTLAYLFDQSATVENVFSPSTGTLKVQKQVTHPYGDNYTVPQGVDFDLTKAGPFDFTIELGAAYANKTLRTSQGDLTADANGVLTVQIAQGEANALSVWDLEKGTSVTVTEQTAAGFTPDAAQKDRNHCHPGHCHAGLYQYLYPYRHRHQPDLHRGKEAGGQLGRAAER